MASTILISINPGKLLPQLSKSKNLQILNRSLKISECQKVQTALNEPEQKFRVNNFKKLIKIVNENKLVEPGYKVLNIGAASLWSHFLVEKTNSSSKNSNEPVGMVIAIDVEDFEKTEGVHCLPKMDFLKQSSQNKIVELLGRGKKFDFILSNMPPPASGVKSIDEKRSVKTFLCMYLFMVKHLRKGGNCLLKIHGIEDNIDITHEAKRLFGEVIYPEAKKTRAARVVYLIGRDFLGIKT